LALDSETLTKPDIATKDALSELTKIRKNYDRYLKKIEEY